MGKYPSLTLQTAKFFPLKRVFKKQHLVVIVLLIQVISFHAVYTYILWPKHEGISFRLQVINQQIQH